MAISGIQIKLDNVSKILGAIKTMTSHDVLVGYPEDKDTPRTGDGPQVTNALIAFVQEHGSPAMNIPARPFMVPGIRSVKERAVEMLKRAALLGLQGKSEDAMNVLQSLGQIGVTAVQKAITVGAGWPPLAESTLEARLRRGVKRTHPLIDTGQLRQHVTYVIRRKAFHVSLSKVESAE